MTFSPVLNSVTTCKTLPELCIIQHKPLKIQVSLDGVLQFWNGESQQKSKDAVLFVSSHVVSRGISHLKLMLTVSNEQRYSLYKVCWQLCLSGYYQQCLVCNTQNIFYICCKHRSFPLPSITWENQLKILVMNDDCSTVQTASCLHTF